MNKTDFFTKLKDLVKNTTSLNICITKIDDVKYACSIVTKRIGEDLDSKEISPIILRGTAEELNEGFFGAITKPIEETNGLFVEMENHEKSKEEERERIAEEKKKRADKKAGKPTKAVKDDEDDDNATGEIKSEESKEKAPKAKTAKEMLDDQLAGIKAEMEGELYESAIKRLKELSKESKDSRIFQMLMEAINAEKLKNAPKLFEVPVVETPEEKEIIEIKTIEADNANPVNPE